MCVHICFGVELHDVDSYKLTWRQCGNCSVHQHNWLVASTMHNLTSGETVTVKDAGPNLQMPEPCL